MTQEKSHTASAGRKVLPWILGVLLLLALAVLGGFYWNQTAKIKNITYDGYHYVSKQDLEKQAHIPTGVSPDSVDLAGITRNIEKLPYVKQARISMEPGGMLGVHITERQPVALLVDGPRQTYIDADGLLLKRIEGKAPDVVLLYGFKATGDTLQSQAFKKASAFLAQLQKHPAADAFLSEVAWNKTKGIEALTNDNGVKVLFGKGGFDRRLRYWETFCRQVIRKKGMAAMKSVDLRFEGQIVTREK